MYTGDEFVASYAPDIAGYTFNGWKDGDGAPFTSDTLWNSLSLYADCTAKTYTVTLDVNEGNALSDTQRTVTYDKAYTFTVPKRTGHTFLGWYIGAIQLTDKNGKSLVAWNRSSDATVTAKWQANDYGKRVLQLHVIRMTCGPWILMLYDVPKKDISPQNLPSAGRALCYPFTFECAGLYCLSACSMYVP